MATAHPLPATATDPPRKPVTIAAIPADADNSLVPSLQKLEEAERTPLSTPMARLPIELGVGVPLGNFRVRNLLVLEPGEVIESEWAHGEDVPLASGKVQLAWSEFEVVDSQLAVRITRLA